MTKEELVKGVTYLGMAYGKEFSSKECEQYYDFLKEYNYQTLVTAIKNLIRTTKFLPKIAELIEACDRCKETTKIAVISFMMEKGYFKSPREYEKATLFLERGIVPDWLANDINKYYRMMAQNNIEHKETLMIG